MELMSKYFSVDIDTHDLIKRIPEDIWTKIEKKLLEEAKEKYGENFTGIDFVDQTGDKISFGIYD